MRIDLDDLRARVRVRQAARLARVVRLVPRVRLVPPVRTQLAKILRWRPR